VGARSSEAVRALFHLKMAQVKAIIWPWLFKLCRIRSTTNLAPVNSSPNLLVSF
jgi:hypothetical protein